MKPDTNQCGHEFEAEIGARTHDAGSRAVVQNRDGTMSLVVVMAQSRYAVATPLGTFDRGTKHLVNRADYPVLLFVGSEEAARGLIIAEERGSR